MDQELIKNMIDLFLKVDYENYTELIKTRYKSMLDSKEKIVIEGGVVTKTGQFLKPTDGIKGSHWTPPLVIDDFWNILLIFSNYLSQLKKEKFLIEDIISCISKTTWYYFGAQTPHKQREIYLQASNNNEKEVSIKKFYKKDAGCCVERNTLAHNLMVFVGIKSYLINGFLETDNIPAYTRHVFTIINYDNQYFLVDYAQPAIIRTDGKTIGGRVNLIPLSIEQYETLMNTNDNVEVPHIGVINNDKPEDVKMFIYRRSKDSLDKKEDQNKSSKRIT